MDAKKTNGKVNPRCNHQIGDLDDKACALSSFASLASFAVNSFSQDRPPRTGNEQITISCDDFQFTVCGRHV